MKLLALAGYRLSGKTLCAQLLSDICPDIQLRSFASPLKSEFAALKGIGIETLNTPTIKEKYRLELNEFAERQRKYDPQRYITKLFEDVYDNDFIVIDDLRRIEELEAIIKRKGMVYRVYSDTTQRRERGWIYDPEIDNNLNETEMNLSAHTFYTLSGGGYIYNTKDLEHLKRQLFTIVHDNFIGTTSPLEYQQLESLLP